MNGPEPAPVGAEPEATRLWDNASRVNAGKLALYSLPLVTTAVIAFAVFGVGAPRPYLGARVYGGPTRGASELSFRIAFIERFVEIEEPHPLDSGSFEVRLADGRRFTLPVKSDPQAGFTGTLAMGGPVGGPITVEVRGPTGLLASGEVDVAVESWRARTREFGGPLKGSERGELRVSVTPGRGAFAVPFVDPLFVDVTAGGERVAGATVAVEADGAEVSQKPVPTDSRGRSSVRIAPQGHVVSLTVSVTRGSETGTWSGLLPVVAGALHAERDGRMLRVESPVEREFGYFALVAERSRLAGGVVPLTPTGRGGSAGTVELPALPEQPLWAVVSSEPELDSASTVGWPVSVGGASANEAPVARAVSDVLWLDGLSLGYRADLARRHKAQRLAWVFTLLAVALAAVLLVRESRRSARALDRHLQEAGAGEPLRDAMKHGRWLTLALALLCVGMGFAVSLLVALYRIG